MRFGHLAASLACATTAHAKAVFAHYMVGNVREFSQADWEKDIGLARASGLDGFVLNVAAGDGSVPGSVAKGFAAAEAVAARGGADFKLFFSFDYEGGGVPWAAGDVTAMLGSYKDSPVYYQQAPGRPFVSTFEGTGNRGDWAGIKKATGAYFVPDWDSLDPREALATEAVDGLFNWDAWPTGAADKTTDKDRAYRAALGPDRTYMMAVSPWFYAHVYGKNWLWRGDDLWFDRWQQVLALQPDVVQLLTWNDYGESHYIGPLYEAQFGLFAAGGAPYNYVRDMPHDGWRQFLPYLIAQYKTGAASIDAEGLTTWYRRSPAAACGTGGTTGNHAGHGQTELPPGAVAQDRVFFTALLRAPADVTVTIGSGKPKPGVWESRPADGGAGLYHGSVPFDGNTGSVVVTVTRQNGAQEVVRVDGAAISTSCTDNITNWNAWVGSATAGAGSGGGGGGGGGTTPAPEPSNPPSNGGGGGESEACVEGTGEGNMAGLCSFACHYNYCPGDCRCTKRGAAVNPPPATGQKGYPRVGIEGRCAYLGLCSFAWDRGYTDNLSACGSDPAGAQGC